MNVVYHWETLVKIVYVFYLKVYLIIYSFFVSVVLDVENALIVCHLCFAKYVVKIEITVAVVIFKIVKIGIAEHICIVVVVAVVVTVVEMKIA